MQDVVHPGAEVVGGEELVAKIQAQGGGSSIPFDKCLATPDMMPKLARIARILGPRGLMPNPKLGTLVSPSAIRDTIHSMKAGRVEYRSARAHQLSAMGRAEQIDGRDWATEETEHLLQRGIEKECCVRYGWRDL